MTAEQAALVALVGRYLAGLLDPFVSLLEVHKLMYFMQEAGEPLELRISKGLWVPTRKTSGTSCTRSRVLSSPSIATEATNPTSLSSSYPAPWTELIPCWRSI